MKNNFKDIEGNEYNTIQIGMQTWICSNLNATKFLNGDAIPEAKNESEWEVATSKQQPICCHYNFNPMLSDEFGRLYNWYAINDSRRISPPGWKVPSKFDFLTLFYSLGAVKPKFENLYLYQKVGLKMKSNYGWNDYSIKNDETGEMVKYGNGTNESKLNALPSGIYFTDAEYDGGKNWHFHGMGFLSCWWSLTEDEEFKNDAIQCILRQLGNYVTLTSAAKASGASLRLLKL
jgi:uncharacterized protein (TIGR02145 family)